MHASHISPKKVKFSFGEGVLNLKPKMLYEMLTFSIKSFILTEKSDQEVLFKGK